jgi:chemotaxis protein histidine kinase CheA
MTIFHNSELAADIVQELVEDIEEHYIASEAALLQLDRTPGDMVTIRQLFRSVHTIKGNLGIVGFTPALPVLTAAEELLSMMRDGSLLFDAMLGDLILLVLDQIKTYVNSFSELGLVEYDENWVTELSQIIHAIAVGSNEQRQQLVIDAIRYIDPAITVGSAEEEADYSRIQGDNFLSEQGFERDKDLRFFRDLMIPIESRSQYWSGRGDRILKMALLLNELDGSPVDNSQLAVAVYAHDFGMAFIPIELLHKSTTLSDAEILLLRSHVQSSAHLLQHMPSWSEAKKIIMQHHEASNGSGYPYGLREREICDGAKILAIADSFDALTHQRAYAVDQKRPIIRAVKEINDCAGNQLSEYWVDVFNRAVQPVLLAHRSGS